jgi:hypothetical protein
MPCSLVVERIASAARLKTLFIRFPSHFSSSTGDTAERAEDVLIGKTLLRDTTQGRWLLSQAAILKMRWNGHKPVPMINSEAV